MKMIMKLITWWLSVGDKNANGISNDESSYTSLTKLSAKVDPKRDTNNTLRSHLSRWISLRSPIAVNEVIYISVIGMIEVCLITKSSDKRKNMIEKKRTECKWRWTYEHSDKYVKDKIVFK